MDEHTISPAGDPFYASFSSAFAAQDQDRPHACYDGLVYMTYTAFDEEVGEEVERLEVVPCRRCGF